jgi:hypothetical protein
MRLIETIALEPSVDNPGGAAAGLPARITVRCKRPQPYPPLLSIIDPCGAAISVECVRKTDWVFALQYGCIAGEGSSDSSALRYCLEMR